MRIAVLIILLIVPLSGCLSGEGDSSPAQGPIVIEGPIDCTHAAITCIEATAAGDKISIDLIAQQYVSRPGIEIRDLDRPLEIQDFLIEGFAVGISVLCDVCSLTLRSGTIRIPDDANVEGITWDGGSYVIDPNATFDERAVEGVHGVEVLGHRTKLRVYDMSFDLPGGGGWFELSPGSLLATRIGGSSAVYVEHYDNQVQIDGLDAKARVRSAMPAIWYGLFKSPQTGNVIIENAKIEGFEQGVRTLRVPVAIHSMEVACGREGIYIQTGGHIELVNVTVIGCEDTGIHLSSTGQDGTFVLESLKLVRNVHGLKFGFGQGGSLLPVPPPVIRNSSFIENSQVGIRGTSNSYFVEDSLFCRNGIGFDPENPDHDPAWFGGIIAMRAIQPIRSSFEGNVPWAFADIGDSTARALQMHGNWWGSPNGPYVVSKNSTSSPLPRDMFGDAIRANAPVYTPFETEPLHTGC